MDVKTALNIVLSLLTAWLTYRNFFSSERRDVRQESRELTEIRVQLNQVMGLLHDMQKDIRTSVADFRALSDRVLIIEEKLKTAFVRIDELKGKCDGRE